jgi:polyisoprenoid-binding protein YceI
MMKTILAAASILAMASGAAVAQTAPSTVDKPAESGKSEKMSPGTTGAMQNEAGSVATSPQDVQKQGGAATAPQAQGDSGAAGKTTGGSGGEKPK